MQFILIVGENVMNRKFRHYEHFVDILKLHLVISFLYLVRLTTILDWQMFSIYFKLFKLLLISVWSFHF
ncbi:hypothetical protein BVG16_20160 [Paenibacillus selenitireducens]|uniref:Uncharacterized protein n=1 Tax=Paenibacillus selenitireducens TaxID=1324314 RepID=A0A1T2X7U2_9BACL|nr:hypothetical protein BVG16_20160 [Paenibacillus selenitireducens]